MVSSVFVTLVTDNGESGGSRATEAGEVGNSNGFVDPALRVGEEGIFRMEIKIWHASLSAWLKVIAGNSGERGHRPVLI